MTPPTRMNHHERMRLRAAAFRATRVVYPGPVGEFISRELMTWQEFGYRLGDRSLIMGVVADIEKTPEPECRAACCVSTAALTAATTTDSPEFPDEYRVDGRQVSRQEFVEAAERCVGGPGRTVPG